MSVTGGAVITGGSEGMGKETALALALAGFDVMIAGRRQHALDEARRELEAAAPNVSVATRATDVRVPAECDALIADAADRHERVTVFVSAAGISESTPILELDAESWDRTIEINLRGTALCAIAAARHMREQGGGRMILFSSISAVISAPGSAHYNASKAGVAALARSLAVELADQGVTVNAIAPGWVATPLAASFVSGASPEALRRLNPAGRLGQPSEIAGLVRYLATEAPTFLTGATLFIDGAETAAAPLP